MAGGSAASLALIPLAGLVGRRGTWKLELALRPLQRPTGRHAWAVAALAVAVGMASGMGVMVHSFERTVTAWIGTTLRADLYVAPLGVLATAAAVTAASGSPLDAGTTSPYGTAYTPEELAAMDTALHAVNMDRTEATA